MGHQGQSAANIGASGGGVGPGDASTNSASPKGHINDRYQSIVRDFFSSGPDRLWTNGKQEFGTRSRWESLHSILLFGICLRIAAPVLATLTSSFSDDTIHALAIGFCGLHLIFHDYSLSCHESDYFPISLNAAMFTAVLLASRLDEIQMVFGFVLFAVICFSLFPLTARKVRHQSAYLHVLVTLVEWCLATLTLWRLDITLFAIYEGFIVLLLLICPLWMAHMQTHYKRPLRGPWDIAKLQD
jgi:phosphatidylinositol N-acetylglucosaminyltransferase subunit C